MGYAIYKGNNEIMSQLASHWRMAYRTTKQAFKYTFKIFYESIKAWLYVNSLKNNNRLDEQRNLYKLMEKLKLFLCVLHIGLD